MQTNLIRQTELERLAERYKIDAQIEDGSSFNKERRNIIASQVYAAFKFLTKIGKPVSDMSMEEFEIAQRELKLRWEEGINDLEKEIKGLFCIRFFRRLVLRQEIIYRRSWMEHGFRVPLAISLTYHYIFPTNYEELVEEIFQIRHGGQVAEAKAKVAAIKQGV